MMNHLKMAGVLDRASGFLLGQFTRCDGDGDGTPKPSIREIMEEFLLPLGKPAVWNLPSGHIDDNMPILLGREVSLSLSGGEISLAYC